MRRNKVAMGHFSLPYTSAYLGQSQFHKYFTRIYSRQWKLLQARLAGALSQPRPLGFHHGPEFWSTQEQGKSKKSLFLIKHHAMKAYGGIETPLYAFSKLSELLKALLSK
jgi:hypothetical protein